MAGSKTLSGLLSVRCVLLQVSAGLSSSTRSCKASSGSRVDVAAASRWSILDREGESGPVFCRSEAETRLFIVVLCCCSYVDVIEQAVVAGDTVLIENLEETIDPVIDPLLGRHTIKKGR